MTATVRKLMTIRATPAEPAGRTAHAEPKTYKKPSRNFQVAMTHRHALERPECGDAPLSALDEAEALLGPLLIDGNWHSAAEMVVGALQAKLRPGAEKIANPLRNCNPVTVPSHVAAVVARRLAILVWRVEVTPAVRALMGYYREACERYQESRNIGPLSPITDLGLSDVIEGKLTARGVNELGQLLERSPRRLQTELHLHMPDVAAIVERLSALGLGLPADMVLSWGGAK